MCSLTIRINTDSTVNQWESNSLNFEFANDSQITIYTLFVIRKRVMTCNNSWIVCSQLQDGKLIQIRFTIFWVGKSWIAIYSQIWNLVGAWYFFSRNTPKCDDAILIIATNPYFPAFIRIVPVILICQNCWINCIHIIIIYEIFA